MNRSERRRLGIKKREPSITIKMEDINRMKQEATKAAADWAFFMMLAVPTMVIHDHFGDLMKKEGREQRFVDLCLDTYKCYESGLVDIQELKQVLKEEAGVEICKKGVKGNE